MNYNFSKSENFAPASIIFVSAICALLLSSNIQALHFLALMLLPFVYINGFKQPWLIVLSVIPLLFMIDPTPQEIGFKEGIIASSLGLYTLLSYAKEFHDRRSVQIIFIGSLAFAILIGSSGWVATSKEVSFHDWARGIAPFLILYLMLPLSFSLNQHLNFKLKWIFISFVVLTLLIIGYINYVFFTEGFNHFYWLNSVDKTHHLVLESTDNIKNYFGPYRDRITLRVQQATSELLPISFTLFTLLSFMAKKRMIRAIALIGATLALFSILETFTRSMLMSALLIVGIWGLFFRKEKLTSYLQNIILLTILGLAFTSLTDINDIWIGRFHAFGKGITEASNEHNVDQNLVSRIQEYKIALSMFAKNPIAGAGLGSKHKIQFQSSNLTFIKKEVGYIHNWFFYWLMVGGIIGLSLYSIILFTPIIVFNRLKEYITLKTILIATCAVMYVYASFFAVFRLISFNFILAIIAATALCLWRNRTLVNEDFCL